MKPLRSDPIHIDPKENSDARKNALPMQPKWLNFDDSVCGVFNQSPMTQATETCTTFCVFQ